MTHPQLKLAEPEIDSQNPWADDRLNRKKCAQTLTQLLEGQVTALTISINGEWGSGKTFMLKRWRQDLGNQGYTAIYFNAWEDDFLSDPLVAIIGQLWKTLKAGSYKELCESVKAAAVPFLKKVGISLLNNGLEKLTGTNIAELTEEELKSASESAFDNYVELTETKDDLHNRLQELANKVYSGTGKPLVFIIDELDRCRPTFAIEVLERVKHLFNINHMVFVLGIDRKQLGCAIQAVYGDIEVENYLHRFIDIDFKISQIDPKRFFNALWNRHDISNHLYKKAQISPPGDFDISEGNIFKALFADIATWHNFSLREIEHSLKLYVLVLRATEPHHYSWPYLIPILILLKMRNPDLYQKYLFMDCSVTDVADFVLPESSTETDQSCNTAEAVIYASFMAAYSPNNEQEKGITDILNAIEKEVPIDNLPFVAKRLKKKRSPRSLTNFSTQSQCIRSLYPNNSYSKRALVSLAKKMDLIITGTDEICPGT